MAQPVIDISILGDKALERKLARLPGAAQKKVLRPAMRKGLKKIIHPAMVAATPVRTGRLKSEMQRVKVKAGRRSRSRIELTVPMPTREAMGIPAESPYFYPAHVEYGRDNVPAQSYVRKPADENAPRLFRLLRREIGKGIEREARKL